MKYFGYIFQYNTQRKLDTIYKNSLEAECLTSRLKSERQALFKQTAEKSFTSDNESPKKSKSRVTIDPEYIKSLVSELEVCSVKVPSFPLQDGSEQLSEQSYIDYLKSVSFKANCLNSDDMKSAIEDLQNQITYQHQTINTLERFINEIDDAKECQFQSLAYAESQRALLENSICNLLQGENILMQVEMVKSERLVTCFTKERDLYLHKLERKDKQIGELELENDTKTDLIKERILYCERQDESIRKAKQALEDKMREKYLYRGNGDQQDRLDQFVIDYMRRNKLYIETIFIQHGLYIIGGGFAVKAQQTSQDRLLVSDGSQAQNQYIKVERHIQEKCPEEWDYIQKFRDNIKHNPKVSAVSVQKVDIKTVQKKTTIISPRISSIEPVQTKKISPRQTVMMSNIPSQVISEYLMKGKVSEGLPKFVREAKTSRESLKIIQQVAEESPTDERKVVKINRGIENQNANRIF